MFLSRTYSPRDVSITYAGVALNEGRPEDVFVTITDNAPRASFRKGLHGDTSSALSPDRSAVVTLSFYPESQSAQILNFVYDRLRDAEALGAPVLGAVPLIITEPAGSTFMVAAEAVLQNRTETSLGADTGTISFEFFVENAVFPSTPPSEIADKINAAFNDLNKGI